MSLARLRFAIAMLLVGAAACAHATSTPSAASSAPVAATPTGHGELRRLTIHSSSLEGNLLGDAATRNVAVYLPPSYARAPQRRYPVVYLLHGYASEYTVWLDGSYQGFQLGTAMDSLIAAGSVREMIIVAPDAKNAYGGSFYTNSTVAGNWEDFITRELVAWTDSGFRTLARPESRAIAGHSMGGYGTVKLAMRHPDIYGAMYAMSPCCMNVDTTGTPTATTPVYGLIARLPDRAALQRAEFYPQVLVAMAAAFSPHPGRAPFQVDLPYEPGPNGSLTFMREAGQQWRANAPLNTLRSSLPSVRRLRAIGFDAGMSDDFRDIPPTVRALDAALTAAGIAHQTELYDGTHSDHIRQRLETKALPFLSKALVGQ